MQLHFLDEGIHEILQRAQLYVLYKRYLTETPIGPIKPNSSPKVIELVSMKLDKTGTSCAISVAQTTRLLLILIVR
jgi:hypothetical protein